jgi:copper(I)-binding protein
MKNQLATALCAALLLALTGSGAFAHIPAAGQNPHALKFPAPALRLVADTTSDAKPAAVTTAGSLSIDGAWARPTPEGTTLTAGYLKITNRGDKPDTLIGASTPVADSAELHESSMNAEGVMTMRPLENGLEIKPGESVELKPAGAHIMILGVHEPLKEGQTIPVKLTFKTAGTVDVTFAIKTLGSAGEHQH